MLVTTLPKEIPSARWYLCGIYGIYAVSGYVVCAHKATAAGPIWAAALLPRLLTSQRFRTAICVQHLTHVVPGAQTRKPAFRAFWDVVAC